MGHDFLPPVALAAALIVVAPAPMRHVRWFARAPRCGITLWLAVAVAAMATLVTLPVILAMHVPVVGDDVALLYAGCMHILTDPRETTAEVGLTLVAAAAGLAPGGWALYRTAVALAYGRRRRRHHLRRATLVAAAIVGDMLVVDDERPAIYCIAGRDGHIIITQGALDRLTDPQVEAACAHERAHMRGRHHLLTGLTDGLSLAVPWLMLFRSAQTEVRRLAELRADDVALRSHGREVLAHALATASCNAADDLSRRDRLRNSVTPASWPTRTAVYVAVFVVAAVLVAVPPVLTVDAVEEHAESCDVARV